MSAPASSVYSNDDAHTIAPSEASLNRRWYTQIKQWTHQLPPDDQEEAVTLLERNVEQRTRRPRVANEDGEGTEVGTVAPGHSISRRASREYRQGQMSVEETERRPESQVLVAEKTEVMPSTSINKKDSTLHMESVKTIKNKQPERPVSTSVHQSSPSKAQGRQSTLIISAEETEDLHTPRPKRGRRPPTPFHPPSDLALSEVPEEEESLVGIEEALFAKGKRESGFERDVATRSITGDNSITASITVRKRYPPPPSTVSKTQTTKQPPLSKAPTSKKSSPHTMIITTATSKKAGHSISSPADFSSTTIILPAAIAGSTAITDDASFPPLPNHHMEEMTVVPEDSISHVGVNINRPLPPRPPPSQVKPRRSREQTRGVKKERRVDRGRRERALSTSSSESNTSRQTRGSSSSSGTDSTRSKTSRNRKAERPSRSATRDMPPRWSSPPPFTDARRPMGGVRTITRTPYEFPPPPDPRMGNMSLQPITHMTSPPLPPQINYHLMRPVPPPSSRQIPTMHVPMLLPSSGSIGSLIGQQNNQQMMMYGNAHWLPPQSSTHHIPGSSSAYTAPTMPHVQGYAAGLAYPDRRGGRASPLPAIRRGSLGLMPLHPMAAGQQSQQGTGLDRMMSRRPSRATSLPLQIQERAGGEKRLERQRMVSNAAPQKAGVADTRVRRTARGLSAGPMLPSPLARTPVSGVRNATPRPAGNVGLSRRTTGIGNMAANGNAPRIRTPQNLRNIPINPRAAAVHRGSGVAGVVGVRRSGNTPGRGSTRPVVTARGAGVRGAPVNRSTGNTGAAGGNPKIAATPAPGAGAGGWVKGLLPPYGRKL